MKQRIIYLCWDEKEVTFTTEVYRGGGVNGHETATTTVTKRARWGKYSPMSENKARAYMEENMNDGRENIRIEIL